LKALLLVLAMAPSQYQTPAQVRAAYRDWLVRRTGPDAAEFVREFGDVGITALFRCTWQTRELVNGRWTLIGGPAAGQRLLAYWRGGHLARLPNPAYALKAVSEHGAPASDWMIAHHEELLDPGVFRAWSADPMPYVYGLQNLPPPTPPEVNMPRSGSAFFKYLPFVSALGVLFFGLRRVLGGKKAASKVKLTDMTGKEAVRKRLLEIRPTRPAG
jgi:hypothetical protein